MDAIRKVLVVDDDPVIGRSIDRVLSGKGYAVITAQNGEDALNKLRSESYDVVYTDIKMPGMSGLEVAERIKASQPWLPVVIVTGYGSDAHEARARAAGVSGFLRKPLLPEMIEESAEIALLKTLLKKDAAVWETAAPVITAPEAAVTAQESTLKNIALFFAAPFVGLAYLFAFPFIGIGLLVRMGALELMRYGAIRKVAGVAKSIVLAVLAPLVGLAYVIALPFIGLAMLAWTGARAMAGKPGPK